MGEQNMDEQLREAFEESRRGGGRRIVYDKRTGQFQILQSHQQVKPDSQTEMTPSNIPNAVELGET
jgi:hypothetical protein